MPLSSASISIAGASCYWYITSDANDDGVGLEELEAAVVAEETAAETAAETATETTVVEQTPTTETTTQSSVLSWLDSLFQ